MLFVRLVLLTLLGILLSVQVIAGQPAAVIYLDSSGSARDTATRLVINREFVKLKSEFGPATTELPIVPWNDFARERVIWPIESASVDQLFDATGQTTNLGETLRSAADELRCEGIIIIVHGKPTAYEEFDKQLKRLLLSRPVAVLVIPDRSGDDIKKWYANRIDNPAMMFYEVMQFDAVALVQVVEYMHRQTGLMCVS